MGTLLGATNSIISAPTRMQNKKRTYLLINIVGSVISHGIAIPLLMNGYYVIALPMSSVISIFTMVCSFWILNRKWFSIKIFDVELLKSLLVLAVPLLPNFLLYWVFHSCDKLMMANLVGVNDVGVYSVASKLGAVSQLIYTAFAGGWQYYAFLTMRDEKQVESNSLIYEYLGAISFVTTYLVCVLSYPIFKNIFPEEYLKGYVIAPYLF